MLRREGSPSKPELDRVRRAMLEQGCTVEQIMTQVMLQWGCRPRKAWRHAYGWTQEDVAAQYNRLVNDSRAPMTGKRISEYESWPHGGAKPTITTLSILARIYATTAWKLIDFDDRRILGQNERLALEPHIEPVQAPPLESPPVASHAEAEPPRPVSPVGSEQSGLLASIPHSFPVDIISGFWVTCYKFDTICHADISQLSPKLGRQMTIKNYPPDPRIEGRLLGFPNDIEAELVNRHLIGRWKNANDNYYFGSIHLAILPGETVMEGYYTCFSSDVQVVAEQWKWVRIDPESLSGIDLSRVVLCEPRLIYSLVEKHSQHDGLLNLTAIVERGDDAD